MEEKALNPRVVEINQTIKDMGKPYKEKINAIFERVGHSAIKCHYLGESRVVFTYSDNSFYDSEIYFGDQICSSDPDANKFRFEMNIGGCGSFDPTNVDDVIRNYYLYAGVIISNSEAIKKLLEKYWNEITPLTNERWEIFAKERHEENEKRRQEEENSIKEKKESDKKLYDGAKNYDFFVIEVPVQEPYATKNCSLVYRKKYCRLATQEVFQYEEQADNWIYSNTKYNDKRFKVVTKSQLKTF